MRILISNDDGINSKGIKTLYEIVKEIYDDVWVIAPDSEQSGASHSLSLRKFIRVNEVAHKHYAVSGTPTDSVAIGIMEIMKDFKPDLVLSGINHGSNVGEDIKYSGTVAVTMEAAMLGIKSIAFSQRLSHDQKSNPSFDIAREYIPNLLGKIMDLEIPDNNIINVNFPACKLSEVKGIKVTSQGRREIVNSIAKSEDPDKRPYYWIGSRHHDRSDHLESDVEAIYNHYISVTPVSLDFTNHKLLEKFGPAIEE